MLKQVQTQKQQHTILPQQIELLNLFHLNTLELEQRIQDELNENPVLEEMSSEDDSNGDKFSKDTVQDFQNWEEYGYDDIPDYKTEYKNYISSEKLPERPIAEIPDFRDELKKQCRFLEIPEEKYFLYSFRSVQWHHQYYNGFFSVLVNVPIARHLSFQFSSKWGLSLSDN